MAHLSAEEEGSEKDGNEEITEEDAWTVISAHFEERGLVGQQLDSYDVFMTNQMQVRFSHFLTPPIQAKTIPISASIQRNCQMRPRT